MARKSNPKPIYQLKDDFIESLDNVLVKADALASMVDTLLDLGQVKGEIGDKLRQRLNEYKKATERE